jgi:hypothetical protein
VLRSHPSERIHEAGALIPPVLPPAIPELPEPLPEAVLPEVESGDG